MQRQGTMGKSIACEGLLNVVERGYVTRLTDTKSYTGTHKQRFDEDGHGRGLRGRDRCSKGVGTVREWYPINDGTTPQHRSGRTFFQEEVFVPSARPKGTKAAFAKWADADGEMCGARFAKMCKTSKLLKHGFQPYDIDVTFKLAAKGKRKMNVTDFARALDRIASKRMQEIEDILALIHDAERPPSATGSRRPSRTVTFPSC